MLYINYYNDYWYFNLVGDVSDEEIDILFEKLTELTNGENRFKFITDSTNLKNISVTKSSMALYNWMYNQRDRIPNTLICSSLIITNNILKDLINGVFYLIPPLSPTTTCSTLNEGINFLNKY